LISVSLVLIIIIKVKVKEKEANSKIKFKYTLLKAIIPKVILLLLIIIIKRKEISTLYEYIVKSLYKSFNQFGLKILNNFKRKSNEI
jgi:hypothetical protein